MAYKEYNIYKELIEKAHKLSKMGFDEEAIYWYNKANDAFYDYEEACCQVNNS